MTSALNLDLTLAKPEFSLRAQVDIPLSGVTSLTGPSGCGKSSLLQAIAGLDNTAEGTITFAGQTWQGQGEFLPPQKRRVGYVFQDTRLFTHLDVLQNLQYGHKRFGADAHVLDGIILALDLTPLLERRVQGLSGGEKQRVAIGRALAMDPQLLLMDEPLSGLDDNSKAEIIPYIKRAITHSNCPVIFVSHNKSETAMLADRNLSVEGGVVTGPISQKATLGGQVIAGANTQGLKLVISGMVTNMPVDGFEAGQNVQVRVDTDTMLLSQNCPKASNALISVPAQIEFSSGADARPYLTGDGWTLDLPSNYMRDFLSGVDQSNSAPVWVSILNADIIK